MIFCFDFHRCSHGPSKIRRHFRNKSRSILKLSKNVFYKKCGQKDSNDFWHRKLTLKVSFRHFLTTPVNICESQIKKLLLFYWFFAKIYSLLTHVRKTPPLRSHYCLCLQAEGNVNRTLNVFELHSVTKKNHAHIVCNIKIYCNFLKFLMVLWFTEEWNPAVRARS